MENTPNYMTTAIQLLGALGLLIYGMKMMSETLQKLAGPQLRHILSTMTSNRFLGMLTGTVVTCAVQSSSATTVMTVSFVNAGLLTLVQAISIIMGANIGTTLTAWIMSFGYNVDLSVVVYAGFFIGILLIYWRRHRLVGDFIYGVAFIFLSLVLLSAAGKSLDLANNEAVVSFFSSFNTSSYSSILLFLAIGTIITCIVQSSAAVMALTIMLCSSGVMPIYLGVALVMGENIGTTATANLAALGTQVQARRAALAHLLFNVIGVMWVLAVFFPFVNIVCDVAGYDPNMPGQSEKLSVVLALFHTCFNVTNTLLLIGFIPKIAKLCCVLIKDGSGRKSKTRLKYIDANLIKTPEILVLQAQREVLYLATRIQQMFEKMRQLLQVEDSKQFNALQEQIDKDEEYVDSTEMSIAQYLEQVSEERLSMSSKEKVRQMLREINELESIADACQGISHILKSYKDSDVKFTDNQNADVSKMLNQINRLMVEMDDVINGRRGELTMVRVIKLENEIKECLITMRAKNMKRINEKEHSYMSGSLFMDIIRECERLCGYSVNVIEAKMGKIV